MTETNAKIHVLADETLSGIKREYVEVDRKAEVGEKIVPIFGDYPYYSEKDYGKVVGYDDEEVEVIFENTFDDYTCYLHHDGYRVLEPTDIVHIDGGRYVLTDRTAEVGEKVMYVDESGESYGIVTEVLAVGTGVVDVAEYEEPSGAVIVGFSHDRYRVLVPVEAAEADEPQPADLIDVVSNLATRVAELERENKKLHAALTEDMKIRSENTRRYLALQDEIDTLHKDNRTLGEELEALKYAAKETDGKVAHLEADIEESFPATDAPLVFICRKPGRFEVYQDGKKLHGVMSVRINAKVGEFATHEIEYISGATEEERQ